MNAQKAIDILERNKEKDAIVCLYLSPYSDKFAAGCVAQVSENDVILRGLSVHGCYDGWHLRALDDVCRIDHGGWYEEKLSLLCRARQTRHNPDFLPPLNLGANLRVELLLAAQHHDLAVAISTGASECICGFVKSVELDYVVLDKFISHGQADGVSTIELERIEKIIVDDEDLQDLKLIARWHEMEPPGW